MWNYFLRLQRLIISLTVSEEGPVQQLHSSPAANPSRANFSSSGGNLKHEIFNKDPFVEFQNQPRKRSPTVYNTIIQRTKVSLFQVNRKEQNNNFLQRAGRAGGSAIFHQARSQRQPVHRTGSNQAPAAMSAAPTGRSTNNLSDPSF